VPYIHGMPYIHGIQSQKNPRVVYKKKDFIQKERCIVSKEASLTWKETNDMPQEDYPQFKHRPLFVSICVYIDIRKRGRWCKKRTAGGCMLLCTLHTSMYLACIYEDGRWLHASIYLACTLHASMYLAHTRRHVSAYIDVCARICGWWLRI